MCLWKTPKISTPSASARDILPSTTTEDPKSPVFGGEDSWKAKRRGAQALQITKVNNSNSNNTNTKGGWTI